MLAGDALGAAANFGAAFGIECCLSGISSESHLACGSVSDCWFCNSACG